jgi:hypothetical protein
MVTTTAVITTLVDPFDTGANWQLGSNVTLPYNDGGNNDARIIGTGVNWNAGITRAGAATAHRARAAGRNTLTTAGRWRHALSAG